MVALQGQSRSFLGIHLTQTQVSLVELIDRGPRLELSTYALADLPVDAQVGVSRQDDAATEKLIEFLRQVFEQAGLSTDAAVFSLYNTHLFSTIIALPPVPDKELSDTIYYKAHQLVPADLQEMIITVTRPQQRQHHVPLKPTGSTAVVLSPVSSSDDDEPDNLNPASVTTNYLIHAIPKSTISWYQQLAMALNLDLIALEEAVFPTMRIHPANSASSHLYVHVDQDNVNLYAANRSAVWLTRTIDLSSLPQGHDHLYIADEIERTVTHHLESGMSSPSQAYLLGRGINLSALQQAMSSRLSCPVNISQPFSGLAYPQGIEDSLSSQGPAFTVAVGLAKRQFPYL